jgi:hypothetical protein
LLAGGNGIRTIGEELQLAGTMVVHGCLIEVEHSLIL